MSFFSFYLSPSFCFYFFRFIYHSFRSKCGDESNSNCVKPSMVNQVNDDYDNDNDCSSNMTIVDGMIN